MNEGFSLDDSIKLIFDGEILVKPSIPLSEEEKKLLTDLYFPQFHKEMKKRLYLSNCLERSEIHDYHRDKNFLQGRAFIFMRRCLNRFDKGRYKGNDFGIPVKGEFYPFTEIDFNFAKEWGLITKSGGYYRYKEIVKGKKYIGFHLSLKHRPELYQELKEAIQLARLKFFWTVFYREAINQLAGETIKWKKNKGIPTKPDLKRNGIDPDTFIKDLKNFQDFQVQTRSASEVREEELVSDDDYNERYNALSEELLLYMPVLFKRYFYCANVLGMERVELSLEFKDRYAQLTRVEAYLKKKIKRLLGEQ